MDLCSVCFTLLACVALCFGQTLVLPDNLNGETGGNITFTPISLPPPPYRSFSWAFERITIVTPAVDGYYIIDEYVNRASFNINTCSFTLRNLTESDSGTYTLTINSARDETSLKIFVPPSNVIIEPSETELVEFNSSVSLTCSALGSSLSYLWFNRSSEVSVGERVELTDDNRTLIITSVRRDDSGPYTCEASNVISNERSPPLSLNIYYGPEDVTVKHVPVEPFYSSGSDVTLTCSAESSPAADFHWALNGTGLGQTGQELKLSNIQSSQSGSYTCLAQNNKTQRSIRSEPISITVLVKISGVTLTGSADVVTEGNPFNLICEGSGDITDIEWMKDNHPLSPGDGITFSPDEKTLMINPVKRKDRGEYQCTISNPISSGTAKYSVTVNFGPDNLRIDGPSEVKDGETLKLSCITESTPKPSYKWTFNESSTQVTTEVFTVEKVSVNNSGTYTCTASNQVTGLNASGSHVLVVKVKKAPGDGGLSGGAIAGIVIGVLLGLAAVAGLSFYFVKTKQKPKTTSSTDKSSRGAQMQGEPELNYAAIQHSQNNWRQYGRSSVNREKRNQGMGMTNQAAPPISDVHIIYSEVRK